jgi:2-keto-4-pentenoate hydratase/2-oxohepta-3-ene-1,7-dioic acid hydratase in catechol pathway
MKLVTFTIANELGPRLGALVPGSKSEPDVLDLRAASVHSGVGDSATFADMLGLIRSGHAAWDQARSLVQAAPTTCLHAAGQYHLLAPLPLPEQIRDFANYEVHVRQAMNSSMHLRSRLESGPAAALERLRASGQFNIPPVWYERPLYYKANRFSVGGPYDDVVRPAFTQRMDYELELAVVIGKKVRDLDESEAMDAVFGYTIYNDFSARDTQSQETSFRMGPAKGKDFDTGNVIGPCIVTPDEIPDPYALRMRAWVNGELRSEAVAGGMQHSIARSIAFVSQSETIYPGELLAMGTVPNGCGYESLSFLNDGDVVEMEVESIGRLRNRIVPPTARSTS